MNKINKHTNQGFVSIITGIIGVVLIMNWFDLFINYPPFILGMVAIVSGIYAKKDRDTYGQTGKILGLIATLVGLTQVIAALVYIYTTSLIS